MVCHVGVPNRGISIVLRKQKALDSIKNQGLGCSGGLGRDPKGEPNPRQCSLFTRDRFLGYTFGYTKLINGNGSISGFEPATPDLRATLSRFR